MTDQERDPVGPGDTPEGHTPEKPGASELGEPGTPGAGMTAAVPHPADAEAVEHGERPADPLPTDADRVGQMDAHVVVSDDDHGHAEPRLGPIDWPAWAYALVGVGAGVLVIVAFSVAVS